MTSSITTYVTRSTILAGTCGALTALALGYNFGLYTPSTLLGTAPATAVEEVHVHADFQMFIGDERIRFTDAEYQSAVGHKLHDSIHFHDGSDEVIHRHEGGITLANFFDSLGLTLTDTCVTLSDTVAHCTDKNSELRLMVNGTRVTDITHYILTDNDRILLYYGNPQNSHLTDYMSGVTDLACMYTGTCPERGTPPTEGCGLTCDVADDQTDLHK